MWKKCFLYILIKKIKNLIPLKIEVVEEGLSTFIQLKKNSVVKDIFDPLSKKNKKLIAKDYIVKIKD